MSEYGVLVLCFAGGLGVGQVFFGGLWWTVRHRSAAASAPLWFLGSFVLRAAVVLFGVHELTPLGWRALIAGGAGFVAARIVVNLVVNRWSRQRCA
jgi:F1F0 ATPase subunit 2